MKPNNSEIAHVFPFFIVYKDGRIEKTTRPVKKIPPSDDPITGLRSKDVTISADPNITGRVFLPRIPDPTRKLPILLYVHGGGYCSDSAFTPAYDRHVRALALGAHAIALSVEYRLAPENPIPACYDDSWAALQWIAAHSNGNGPDPWFNEHADFSRVFIGGDSAGGNITNHLGSRAGLTGLPGIKLSGLFLVHPMFGGLELDDKMWMLLCPDNRGRFDQRIQPTAEDLARIPCGRVLVSVAQKDSLSGPGRCYYENLKRSGWRGTVELVECEGEDHCFHLWHPGREKSIELVNRIVRFIKEEEYLVSSL